MTTDHPKYAPGGYVPAPGTEAAEAISEFVGAFQEAMAEATRRYNMNMRTAAAVIRASLPDRGEPTDPPPDLARDDDAQSEVGESLRERVAEVLRKDLAELKTYMAQVSRTDWGTADQADAMAGRVFAVVGPELDRHIGAHRRDNQRHANVTNGLCEQNERLQRGLDNLRSELAAMTAQRDALIEASLATDYTKDHECGTAVDDPDAYDVALANITEMHRVLLVRIERLFQANDARDEAIRRASEAEGEEMSRGQLLVKLDRIAEKVDDLTRNRDTAQAEVKELREELERWTSGQRRKAMPRVESVRDAIGNAAGMVRASYREDIPDNIADMMRANAHQMKQLHDAASTLIAERDALQARIDAALTWCPVEPPEVTSGFAYQTCVKQIRLALLPEPAYDGSCGASHYGKCGPKNLDCLRRETPLPADDSSEAEAVPPGLNPMGED